MPDVKENLDTLREDAYAKQIWNRVDNMDIFMEELAYTETFPLLG